jgi:hypothetical protein
MMLAEIRDQLEHLSDGSRSGTADERKFDLVMLDDLLGELDDMTRTPPLRRNRSTRFAAGSRS